MNKRKHFHPHSLSLLLSLACRVRRLEPGDILLECFAPWGHGQGAVGGLREREEEKLIYIHCKIVQCYAGYLGSK